MSAFANPESWVALAFVLFVLLFGAKLWRKIAAILDQRAQAVERELEEASRLKSEATAMLADAQKRRENALQEAATLLKSAHEEAERLAAQARADAMSAAQRRERLALDRIALAERTAMLGLRQLATDTAIDAATRIIASEFTEQGDRMLIDHAIAMLPADLASTRVAA